MNGGHTAPFLIRAGGAVERLDTGGPVVGLITPVHYEQMTIVLERGDLIVLYTDGLSEAMNHEDEEFGEERLLATIRSNAAATPTDLIAHLIAAADGFAAGAPQHDDMTVLVVRAGRRRGDPCGRLRLRRSRHRLREGDRAGLARAVRRARRRVSRGPSPQDARHPRS